MAPAILTSSFYGMALYAGARPKQARLLAAAASLVFMVGKEVYDYNTAARSFSTSDLAFGAAGTAIGLAVAEKITWPEEKRSK